MHAKKITKIKGTSSLQFNKIKLDSPKYGDQAVPINSILSCFDRISKKF